MSKLPKINKLPSGYGTGFSRNQEFANLIFLGNDPDKRTPIQWVNEMRKKGFKDVSSYGK